MIEVRGARPDEIPDVLEMVPRVMGAPSEYFASVWRNSPGSKPEHSRLILLDGRYVSHIRLHDRTIRIGYSTIRQGGVADVCTLPEHRRKGYGRRLLEDAASYFLREGYDLSIIISGVFYFYCNCGYERYPLVRYKVKVDSSTLSKPYGYHVRRFERGNDLAAVADIYDSYNSGRPLTCVRSYEYWRRHFWWIRRETEDGFYVAEHNERIVGYIRNGPSSTLEIGYLPDHDQAAVALFEATMRLMAKRRQEWITLTLPSDEPLLSLIKERFEVEEQTYETTLVRIINLPQLLRKLSRHMTLKLAEMGYDGEVRLGIRIGEHEGGLIVEGCKVTALDHIPEGAEVIETNQSEFMKLITNNDFEPQIEMSPEVEEMFKVAAPDKKPIFWPIDVV
jgi:GNAT superfamily N-acetyltransferase